MYLKRLEIQGFKSFAKKTVLEFEPGVTSIVGPNGSGKSNVADAVRWVLGEQSTRLLRGKKSDDVIFAGSDKKIKLGFAECVATFDNVDHKIPVDTAEVSIGRRVDRTGESEYLINGNRVRLLDIVDLVLKSNIGTSRYTVIGQGTIDQMVMAGPAEVKNLIDEASGVRAYYLKREKTLRRLDSTAQNLIRAEDVINEIEPRLKSLRRQAKRMEARETIQTELKLYQREWYGQQYHTLAAAIVGREARLQTFSEKRKALEDSMQDHLKKLETHETSGLAAGGTFTKLRDKLQQFQDQKNRLLENLSLIRGKMESFKTAGTGDNQTLTIEAHSIRRKIEETTLQIRTNAEEETELDSAIAALKTQLQELEAVLTASYESLTRPGAFDWQELRQRLDAVDESLQGFLASLDQARSIEEVKREADKFKSFFGSFRLRASELFENPGSVEISKHKLQDLLKQKEHIFRQLQASESSVSRARISHEFLVKQLEALEQQNLHTELELKKSTAGSSDIFLEQMIQEESKVKTDLQRLGEEMQKVQKLIVEFQTSQQQEKDILAEDERRFRREQDELSRLRDGEALVQIEKARLDTQMEALVSEVTQSLGPVELEEIKREQQPSANADLEEKIQKLKHQLELIGGVDELTLKEYEETEGRFGILTDQTADLKRGIEDLRQIIEELDEHIRKQFNESFARINEKFEFYFRMLFNGGRGTLTVLRAQDSASAPTESVGAEAAEVLEASLRPEEKLVQKYEQGANNIIGIDIKATPAGKKLSSIQALSGGERALTSIALLCAMLACFPSPFVVLDEVDAALDEANTIRFGQILATLAHQTQFVTITHNRETMAQSNTLYGVTMGDEGISKILSVKFDQATEYAK